MAALRVTGTYPPALIIIIIIINQPRYTPEVPRGFQELKVPRFHDNNTGWR